MNLTLPELLLTLVLIGLALWRSKAALFLLWPIAILVFPTARLMVGFPLYVYDVIAVAILVSYHRQILGIRWSAAAVPWHYVFGALILVCGLLWPIVIYSLIPEIVWVSGHAMISFMTFAIGAAVVYRGLDRERRFLGYGIAASLIAVGLIGLIQFGSYDMSRAVTRFFYRDYAADAFVMSDFYAQITASRAAGPYGSANGLGIVGVLAGLMALILVRNKALLTACLVAAAIAVMASVSRQAMMAAALALMAYFALAPAGQKSRLTLILIMAGPLLIVLFLGSDFSASIMERFGRWDSGIQQDDNFAARYVRGPIRLFETVAAFPDIILFGTGPDLRKLYSAGAEMIDRARGFLSIGYGLFFFQYGVIGLVAALWMHVQAWSQLRFAPPALRGSYAAILTAIVTFYIADNTPNVSESVAMLCLLPLGMLAGHALRVSQAQVRSRAGSARPRYGPAPRPVAAGARSAMSPGQPLAAPRRDRP